MQKFVFLACICLALAFVCLSDVPAKAQNPFNNQPSGTTATVPAEKKETAEKTDQTAAKANENGDEPDNESEKIAERSFKLTRGARTIEIVPGYAPMQPVFFSGRKEYNTDGRRLSMINIRFTRTMGTVKNVTYQYFFELTPLAVAFNNEVKNPNYVSDAETPDTPKTIRKTAYGFGFQPVNFRFIFKSRKRVKPFVQIGCGMIFFNKRMPVPEATAYNFTGDFGGGLYISTSRENPNKAITIAYRYFHISNFNTSDFNPGYNANVFSIGYSFFRR